MMNNAFSLWVKLPILHVPHGITKNKSMSSQAVKCTGIEGLTKTEKVNV